MMRLKLFAFAVLFIAPVWLAMEVRALREKAADGQRVLDADLRLSRRLAEQQSHPLYTPPEQAVYVSMLH